MRRGKISDDENNVLDSGGSLCLIDFDKSRKGSAKELVRERKKLDKALDMPVVRLPGWY